MWLKDLTRVPGHMVAAFLMSFLKQSSSRAHVMSHTLPDHAPVSLQHDTPISQSLLYRPNRTTPCATPQGLLLSRFAEQSPLTGLASS